jgi:uncharacterized protein YbjT (DUF2867 family)
MDVVIAGGHGQIALQLTRLLARRGDRVRGLIRKASQSADLEAAGAEPVVLDLEHAGAEEVAAAIEGADPVVFAAGAGPGSGAARKETVDYGAAVALLEAARSAGVPRYVMVSAMGTDDPPDGDEVFSVYLRAKARADREVMDSDRAWTVVRPGGLTDDEAAGRVTLARHVPRGKVPRADVAAVLAAALHDDRTAGHVFELVGGDTPIPDALDELVARGAP